MRALITGGGGFLGRAIAERLLAGGHELRSLSRGDYPELRAMGVETRRADLADADAVRSAASGCDVVFHVAARAGLWGPYASYYDANVRGTEHVIDACRAAGVPRLVYTSSPSVVFNGSDLENADELLPYPDEYLAHYPRTKAVAERLVLRAADARLRTVALRPHLIWGPRDNHLVPRILARAARLRRIGRADKLVDSTYVDNAAEAHVLAAEALDRKPEVVSGRAYFISQGDPRPVWWLINAILSAGGKPPVRRTIHPRLARWLARGCELACGLLRLRGEPPLTRFLVEELTTAHWFDLSAARRDLGYEPRVSIDEGLDRLAAWLSAPRG
ncbi:MAG: 2-alkyl-3-oxoalkanoate reductase [Phycisphaerae bacterium]|nr:2-alkyl-3-oxoalkanoate reductase [Phycisphaerae bacterium]